MSKYTEEFKLKVVKYCLEGNHSRPEAEKYFSIPKKSGIKIWIRKYQEHGIEGLVKKQKSSYSGEYKKYVVEYMQRNHLSATEAAVHFNLGSGSVVSNWERIYYEKGPQGLYSKQRGRAKNMKLKLERKLDKKIEEDLVTENQRLRMENEYLKKLNALVQERIKREGKKK